MVHVYFFRGELYENGKDWLDTFGSGGHTCSTVIDTKHVQLLLSPGYKAIGSMDVALRMSTNIAKLAGIDSADVSVLLRKYQNLFSWELKQRGFLLKSTMCYVRGMHSTARTQSLGA